MMKILSAWGLSSGKYMTFSIDSWYHVFSLNPLINTTESAHPQTAGAGALEEWRLARDDFVHFQYRVV